MKRVKSTLLYNNNHLYQKTTCIIKQVNISKSVRHNNDLYQKMTCIMINRVTSKSLHHTIDLCQKTTCIMKQVTWFFHTYQIIKGGCFEMAGYFEVTPWPVCAILDSHLKPCGIFITKFVNTRIISSFFQ